MAEFVIPAIDIMDGKCVRLTQGDYGQKKIYDENPLEVAKRFEDAGLTRLHLVDLDGARSGSVRNWKTLESIAGKTRLSVDFGGGIKTPKDLEIVFNGGAGYASIGSIAVTDETLFYSWISQYGPEKFLLGADVREEKLAIHGWKDMTEVTVFGFINKYQELGIEKIFCTDISKDGLLQGPSLELYGKILEQCPKVFLIASGGVSTMDDIRLLKEAGCGGVIVGKAIYEGRITLKELGEFYI
jgi:phosphoribosylformimino-5-aminoimidazole carboxamide ribotide isomerase